MQRSEKISYHVVKFVIFIQSFQHFDIIKLQTSSTVIMSFKKGRMVQQKVWLFSDFNLLISQCWGLRLPVTQMNLTLRTI